MLQPHRCTPQALVGAREGFFKVVVALSRRCRVNVHTLARERQSSVATQVLFPWNTALLRCPRGNNASQRKPFVVRHFVPADLQQKEPYRSLEHDPSGDFKGYFSEMGLKWGAVPFVGVIEDVRQGSWNASKNMLTPCHYDDVDNVKCGIFEGARSFCSSLQRINRTCTCLTQPI